jgi:hypothetical protein
VMISNSSILMKVAVKLSPQRCTEQKEGLVAGRLQCCPASGKNYEMV